MRDPCLGMPWGPPTIPGHGVSGQPCMLCCTQMFHNFTTLIPESQLIFNQENSALTQGEVTREFLGIWKKKLATALPGNHSKLSSYNMLQSHGCPGDFFLENGTARWNRGITIKLWRLTTPSAIPTFCSSSSFSSFFSSFLDWTIRLKSQVQVSTQKFPSRYISARSCHCSQRTLRVAYSGAEAVFEKPSEIVAMRWILLWCLNQMITLWLWLT